MKDNKYLNKYNDSSSEIEVLSEEQSKELVESIVNDNYSDLVEEE